jgi:hypothetical protein
MPDARCTRGRLCNKKSTGVSNQGYTATAGGFKRLSQHFGYGGCDEHSKEAINTGAAGVAGPTACCGAS